MDTTAIQVEDIAYSYGDIRAVDGMSFSLAPGEILGFLGPNGAGKTTAWKMLTAQMLPQRGSVTVLGMSTRDQPKAIQSRIGVCFEYVNLYEQLSARQNIDLFARLFGIRKYDVEALLSRLDFEDRGKQPVGEYSKGMKQRIMVARSLVNSPEILFLDEPTAGLDPVSAESIRRVIREERARGASIFLTTHDMWEAEKLCDRVAFVNEGKITAMDTPMTLKRRYGKRILKALVANGDGTEEWSIPMDEPDTPETVRRLFAEHQVVTIHSEEATLEDIFIEINGRGLGS